MLRSSALLLSALVALSACSGDDDAAATTIAESTTIGSTAPSTTGSTTTTPTTIPTTTSAPNTDASTTTDRPPTSVEVTIPTIVAPPTTDLEQIRAEVAAAVVSSWEALDRVLREPASSAANEALRAATTDEEYDGIFDRFVVRYVANDLAERTNPESPAYVLPYPETLVVDLEAGTAEMDNCHASTNLLVQSQPDGSEVVQDDTVALVIGTDAFVLVDGVWLDSGGRTREVIEGEVACPDA